MANKPSTVLSVNSQGECTHVLTLRSGDQTQSSPGACLLSSPSKEPLSITVYLWELYIVKSFSPVYIFPLLLVMAHDSAWMLTPRSL